MPATKQRIVQSMKMEQNPLVYLEFTPPSKRTKRFKPRKLFAKRNKRSAQTRFCMGYVSRPYESTYRITTCRHLVAKNDGTLPTKVEILEGLEVFARYEGEHKKLHSLMFEDVNIKTHIDELADLLFIEILHPDNYNFQLLNQASASCAKRFPGNEVYYFQNHQEEAFFRLFEGKITTDKIYIIEIANDGNFFFHEQKPNQHYRMFNTIDTIKNVLIKGASGSPLLSREGEVVGMICAHEQSAGKGIYLTIEKIERLYDEIRGYHV